MNSSSTRSIAYAAIGAALIAALSQISIPLGPVPFTLQTLAIGLIATLYYPKEAVASVALYLTLGAIGLPVFAGGSGGFQALFGATGGFLWAFLIYALVTANLTYLDSSIIRIFLANCLGVALVLLGGAAYFKFFNGASWTDTLAWTVIPFILTGILKIVVVILIAKALQPALKKEAYFM
ncbi:biotin transporter BioY [Streptococcus sp. X16XC17]|uniref:biotin transporter BioY n=1 Tax=unclassified Streptococcus TaxID=2608887 RepID=UPI00066FE2F2|nr:MULTISPECIES: biotin transporter BioY [unclassified Streptococcus]TCD46174.1 biotin transporter BioY [Streptococcus sp. X16XC17]